MDGTLYSILMILIMVGIFYVMLIRPENKRKKQAAEMRASLKVGNEVTTIGGIVGTICAVKENSVVIETGADRVRLEIMKWAISSKGVQTSEEQANTDTEDKKTKKK